MKRHRVLQDLSRDHHSALVVARRLQGAGGEDAIAIRDAFLEFWRTAGERHFRIEEEALLPTLARAGGAEEPIVSRVLHDHAEIRLNAMLMQSRLLSAPFQAELGELLADHVRLEERELFPLIEATLTPEALSSLGRAISEAEGKR
jgi:hemerythrin-like domain-containing protein